jgi:hypothetical protein
MHEQRLATIPIRMPPRRTAAFVLALAAAIPAQTFVVDAANGPGTHFTEIAAAVAAVPDGATIEVRAGAYLPFSITGKGVSVFGLGGVTLTGQGFVVHSTSAAQTVVVRGVQVNLGRILLAACQGPVVLEQCSYSHQGFLQAALQLDVHDCAQVHVADCLLGGDLSPAAQATDSTVLLRGSTLRGGTCLFATASTVDFVDCVQQTGSSGFAGTTAMFLQGGSVRLVGGSITARLGTCIAGTGSARVDPSTTMTPRNGFPVSTIPMTLVPMPSVVASDGPLGGAMTTTMRGPDGGFGGLLVGLPGAAWTFPGIAEPIWLLRGTEAVCALAGFAAGTSLQVVFTIPNAPALRGARFGWQGVSHDAATGLQASNPAITTHW